MLGVRGNATLISWRICQNVARKEFKKRNEELQQKLIIEIEKAKTGESNKNIMQLQAILNELRNNYAIENNYLNYPHIIIDSWDYSDQLGNELIELAELYKMK